MDWKCPSCKGKGYLLINATLQKEINLRVRRYEKCKACEGTGFKKRSEGDATI